MPRIPPWRQLPVSTRQHRHPLTTCRPIRPATTPKSTPTCWSCIARLMVGIVLTNLCGIVLLGLLSQLGYTTLVAQLIVGGVLLVVFGTPLLCVLGLIMFYLRSMMHLARSRRPNHSYTTQPPAAQTTVVISEVVFDE